MTIVEGYGELEALPTLIRRIARQQLPAKFPKVTQPIRVSASQFLKFSNEFARTLKLASNLTEDAGAIVIVLDCDDDCPKVLGPEILCKAKAIVGHVPISVCLAYREFETWFLAAAISLRGVRTLRGDLEPPDDPVAIRGAKGWIERNMAKAKYSERLDQPALAEVFDMQAALTLDSFDKFHREILSILANID